jgi:hypothetical protein
MKCVLFFLFVLLSCKGISQKRPEPSKAKLVKVTDYGRLMFLLPEEYWENKAAQIERQIGVHEFEMVKKYSHRDNIPCEMQIFCEDKNGNPKKSLDSLKKKQSRLKVYHIATYTHIDNFGNNKGEYCILRVPYLENKNWDTNVTWDTVYFIIRKDVVKEL